MAFLLISEFLLIEFTHTSIISISLLRVFRIIRFNSLITNLSKQLKLGLDSLKRSKLAAYNLSLFLILVIFVYGLVGVVAFRRVAHIFSINENVSFHTIGQSFILLYQISTSAGWDGVYTALKLQNQFNAFLIALYVLSFLLISIFVTLNLVITVILNFYVKSLEIEEESRKLKPNDLSNFNEKWQSIAQSNEPLFIQKNQLIEFLKNLDSSSSLLNSITINEENVKLLGIPLREEKKYYRGDVLIALNRARLRQSTNK